MELHLEANLLAINSPFLSLAAVKVSITFGTPEPKYKMILHGWGSVMGLTNIIFSENMENKSRSNIKSL